MAFPEGFVWGTAAASTQTEGAAPAGDWSAWEGRGRAPSSGEGNGFTHRYAEDFHLYAEHRLTHHRLSLEWARIEPGPGRHDPDAIEHYLRVLRAARDAGVEVWACLHHFSLPGWFADDEGGFRDDRARSRFWQRHVAFCAETFGDLVSGWMPINEPAAYAVNAFLWGRHPPGVQDPEQLSKALRGILLAGRDAWRELRGGGPPVATVHNLSPIMRSGDSEVARRSAEAAEAVMWRSWIRALRDGILDVPGRAEEEVADLAGSCDLVGLSYFSALAVLDDGNFGPYPADARTVPLGYAPWSEGLGLVLRRVADELPGWPLLVAGHGVATDDDEWRGEILQASLGEIERAIDDGIDVRGFLHWTGVDGYEWLHGYDIPFGLFDRDRQARPSAGLIRDAICR